MEPAEAYAALVALAATASTDPLAWLVNLGVAGVVIVLLVTGQLRTKAEVENLKEEIAAKDKVIEAFQLQLTGHTLPALAQSARVLEAIPGGEAALLGELRLAQQKATEISQRLEKIARGEVTE